MGVVDAGIQWDPKLFSYLGSCSGQFCVFEGSVASHGEITGKHTMGGVGMSVLATEHSLK